MSHFDDDYNSKLFIYYNGDPLKDQISVCKWRGHLNSFEFQREPWLPFTSDMTMLLTDLKIPMWMLMEPVNVFKRMSAIECIYRVQTS